MLTPGVPQRLHIDLSALYGRPITSRLDGVRLGLTQRRSPIHLSSAVGRRLTVGTAATVSSGPRRVAPPSCFPVQRDDRHSVRAVTVLDRPEASLKLGHSLSQIRDLLRQGLRLLAEDEGARPWPGLHVAFPAQLLNRTVSGLEADSMLVTQFTRRGRTLPHREAARLDVLAKVGGDLLVRRHGIRVVRQDRSSSVLEHMLTNGREGPYVRLGVICSRTDGDAGEPQPLTVVARQRLPLGVLADAPVHRKINHGATRPSAHPTAVDGGRA